MIEFVRILKSTRTTSCTGANRMQCLTIHGGVSGMGGASGESGAVGDSTIDEGGETVAGESDCHA